jgi:DNA-binding NarL/FixJ family response regulator
MQIRVVVAADFPMVREAIVRELAEDPAIEVVGEAADGDDAIALTRDLLPDVMVLDLHTPGMGVDVLGRLSGAGSPVRVVAMTAGEQASWPHAAVAAGAAGVLSERSTGEQVRSAVLAVHGGSGVVMAATLVDPLLADDAGTGDHGYGAVSKRIGPRELAVLQLVAQGMTDAEIGVALGVSVSTVNKRLARVRQKTGLRHRSALVSWVVQHGSPDRAPAGRAGG